MECTVRVKVAPETTPTKYRQALAWIVKGQIENWGWIWKDGRQEQKQVQKTANGCEVLTVEFVFDGSILCQQGVNAGMSQQDENGF